MGSPDGEKRGSLMRGPLGADELGVVRERLQREIDVALRAHEQRDALVQLRRLDVEQPRLAVDRRAARLLADERERIRLVEQSQLSLRALAAVRIAEHAAAEEIAMEVRDERANVAHREMPALTFEAAVLPHQLLGRLVPVLLV